jgi:hypothetical protein
MGSSLLIVVWLGAISLLTTEHYGVDARPYRTLSNTSTLSRSSTLSESEERSLSMSGTVSYTFGSASVSLSRSLAITRTQTLSFSLTATRHRRSRSLSLSRGTQSLTEEDSLTPSRTFSITTTQSLTGLATVTLLISPTHTVPLTLTRETDTPSSSRTSSWALLPSRLTMLLPQANSAGEILLEGEALSQPGKAAELRRTLDFKLEFGTLDETVFGLKSERGDRCFSIVPADAFFVNGATYLVNKTTSKLTMVLPLRSEPLYDDYTFTVEIGGWCIVGRTKPTDLEGRLLLPYSVTILKAAMNRTFPPWAVSTLSLVGSAAGILGGASPFGVSSASALRANAVLGLQLAAECNLESIRKGRVPVPFPYHIFQFTIPRAGWTGSASSDPLGYFIASVVMNQALSFLLVFVGCAVAAKLASDSKKSFTSRLARLHLPSVVLPVTLFLTTGSVFSGVALVVHSDDYGLKVGGAVTVAFQLAWIFFLTLMATAFSGAEWLDRLEWNEDGTPRESQDRLSAFFIGNGEWVDDELRSSDHRGYLARWGSVKRGFGESRSWYFGADALFALAYAAIAAQLPPPGRCQSISIAGFSLLTAEIGLRLVLSPDISVFLRYWNLIKLLLQWVGALFSLLYHQGVGILWTESVASSFFVVALGLCILEFVVSLALFGVGRFARADGGSLPRGGPSTPRRTGSVLRGEIQSPRDEELLLKELLQRQLERLESTSLARSSTETPGNGSKEVLRMSPAPPSAPGMNRKHLAEGPEYDWASNPLLGNYRRQLMWENAGRLPPSRVGDFTTSDTSNYEPSSGLGLSPGGGGHSISADPYASFDREFDALLNAKYR